MNLSRKYAFFILWIVVFIALALYALFSTHFFSTRRTCKCPKPEQKTTLDDQIEQPRKDIQEEKKEVFHYDDSNLKKYWMLIIIPTVSRSTNYLHETLQSYISELPSDESDPLYNSIKIIVFDNNKHGQPNEHFEEAKKINSHYLEFVKMENLPIVRTRRKKTQQTSDVVTVLKYVLENYQSHYIMLAEDDFTLCPNGMMAIYYVINKATKWNKDWTSIRVSYGLNGIIMKLGEDVKEMMEYMSKYMHGAPVDHLFYNFVLEKEKKTQRPFYAYRNNLHLHIGKVSTFPGVGNRYVIPCHGLLYDWLQEYERFRNEDCPNEDLSPCKDKNSIATNLIDFDMNAKKMCRHHFPLCDKRKVKTIQEAIDNYCNL